jgi:hypothetical protein
LCGQRFWLLPSGRDDHLFIDIIEPMADRVHERSDLPPDGKMVSLTLGDTSILAMTMTTSEDSPRPAKKTAPKPKLLSAAQREVLEALAGGALMTLDRMNLSWIGDKAVAFQTRTLLAQRRLITRLDVSRNADASGNGFTISTKGRALLAAQPVGKSKRAGAPGKVAEPTRPPSEAQLAYARDFGIQVPADATMPELGSLISRHTDRDVEPSDEELTWAHFFHVEHTRYVGRRALQESMRFTLSRPAREPDLVRWFSFCAGTWLEPALSPRLTGLGDPRLERVCAALLADDAALKSIRRYATSEALWLPPLGSTGGVPRVSTDTAGYRLAGALFRVTLAG